MAGNRRVDVNGVDLWVLQQRSVVRVSLGHAERVADFVQLRFVAPANPDHLDKGMRLVNGNEFRSKAQPDDRNSYLPFAHFPQTTLPLHQPPTAPKHQSVNGKTAGNHAIKTRPHPLVKLIFLSFFPPRSRLLDIGKAFLVFRIRSSATLTNSLFFQTSEESRRPLQIRSV